MTAHIERYIASLNTSWAPSRLTRFAETAKKTGIASSLVGLGAALHLAWHALPFFEAATAGGLVLACHS
ncbi:hypothetical protein [Hyphococcus sp.]|uniref:hypothetical protein n=1 Tax=Hyphococcus sp. TaxID=2038636 RepID=UPI00207FAE94|nr:MAG: hypothetical protein DHS20C04_28940 [Marinicaulis sp.]